MLSKATFHLSTTEMLRFLALLIALCGLVPVSVSAQTASALFRHIDLGLLGRVELGEAFSQAERIAISESDGIFRLRQGTFGGAAAIRVHVVPDGRVAAMHFEYEREDSNFDGYVQNAAASFGPPRLLERTAPDGEQDEVALWEDPRTILEVVRRVRGNDEDVFVAMYDRELSGK